MEECTGCLARGRGRARPIVSGPPWQGQHAAIRVIDDDLEERTDTPDVSHSQGVAMQGVNGIVNGDTAQRLIGLLCSSLIVSLVSKTRSFNRRWSVC